MKREFLLNIAFLLVVNLIIKPLYLFGVDRSVQNLAAEGAYGLYFALFNFTFLFQILTDLGIQYYNNRHVAQHRHLLRKYFPVVLTAKALLALVYAVAVLAAAAVAGYLWESPRLLAALVLIQVLNALVLYLRSNISGLGWYYTDSLLSVMDKFLLILLLGVPIWLGWIGEGFPISWFAYAQAGTVAITAVTATILLGRESGWPRLRLNVPVLRLIFRQSFPYALAVALMTLYTRMDAVLIERLLPDGPRQADWYASAYRLLDASNMIGFLFAGLLLPMFARMQKLKMPVQPLADLGLRLIWSGAIPLVVATVFFREPVMAVLYHSGGEYSGRLLGWLMISFIPVSGSYIFGTLLVAYGHLGPLNRVYAIAVAGNLALNLLLLPLLRAEGAAIAALSTQAFIFLAQLALCRRLEGFAISLAQALRFGTYAALIAGMALGWKTWFPAFDLWSYLGILALAFGLAFPLGLVRWRELLNLAKKEGSPERV